jgi:hypothetical protein
MLDARPRSGATRKSRIFDHDPHLNEPAAFEKLVHVAAPPARTMVLDSMLVPTRGRPAKHSGSPVSRWSSLTLARNDRA